MLDLQELSKLDEQHKKVVLDERLPSFLKSPCEIDTSYKADFIEDFYLLHLSVKGNLKIICQRCLEDFNFEYNNQLNLAICPSEERAQELFEHYESIVSVNKKVNLQELIIDELHLYVPVFHPEIQDCNEEITQLLTGKADS